MKKLNLLQNLVYFDTAYIADLYEVKTGESPKTQITKNQAKKAGANIPLFSAEISAQETRSFSVSSFEMLSVALDTLREELELDPKTFRPEMKSKYGWIKGNLSVVTVKASTKASGTGKYKTVASDTFFCIHTSSNTYFSLITTPEYFSSGLDTFLKLKDTTLKKMSIPIEAYIRVLAAQDHQDQWIAIPLVVFEMQN